MTTALHMTRTGKSGSGAAGLTLALASGKTHMRHWCISKGRLSECRLSGPRRYCSSVRRIPTLVDALCTGPPRSRGGLCHADASADVGTSRSAIGDDRPRYPHREDSQMAARVDIFIYHGTPSHRRIIHALMHGRAIFNTLSQGQAHAI